MHACFRLVYVYACMFVNVHACFFMYIHVCVSAYACFCAAAGLALDRTSPHTLLLSLLLLLLSPDDGL